jgi:transposase
VADSALVTENNLRAMGEELQFISHLPNSLNLASELTRAAFIRDSWLELGKISSGRKSASYKLQEFKKEPYGR